MYTVISAITGQLGKECPVYLQYVKEKPPKTYASKPPSY